MRTALSNQHQHISIDPPRRKVWRVRLYAKEIVDCGFTPELIDPWNLIFKPLLKAKGLPEGFTLDRTPVNIEAFDESEHGPGIELEFE